MKEFIDEPLHDVYVKVPVSYVDDLNISNNKISILDSDTGLILRKKAIVKRKPVSLVPIILSGVLYVLAMLVFFRDQSQVPFTGSFSIASLVIIVTTVTGMFNFSYRFISIKKRFNDLGASKIPWRNYPVILFSHTVMIVLGLLLAFRVIGEFFKGASFDHFTASLIGFVIVAVINYLMVALADALTPSSLINTLIFIIFAGVGISMLTNSDHQWWLYNLSFLGTPEATNAWQFNATLMVSALLMVALIDYLFLLLYGAYGTTLKLKTLKLLLILTAICLGGVGLFPYNSSTFSQQMHNRVAGYLVYLFIVLIVLIRWIMPEPPKEFVKLSYTVGILLIISVVLFQGIHYLSLTAFELVAFVLAFSWLLLLLKLLIDKVQTFGKIHEFEVVRYQDIDHESMDSGILANEV